MDWSLVRLPGLGHETTAVVIGAGGAVGSETAGALVSMGATVALVTRSEERSAQLANAATGPGKALGFGADVSDPASLADLAARIQTACGSCAALINCAAVGSPRKDFADVSRAEAERIFAVNVFGALDAAKALAPLMDRQGGGKIVNVASIAAERVLPGGGVYGVSKAALVRLSQQLAVELGPRRINVNTVSPGQTPTRLRRWDEAPGEAPEAVTGTPAYSSSSVPLRRRGELADYVGAIVFLCSSLADYVTGVDIAVEGGVRLVRPTAY